MQIILCTFVRMLRQAPKPMQKSAAPSISERDLQAYRLSQNVDCWLALPGASSEAPQSVGQEHLVLLEVHRGLPGHIDTLKGAHARLACISRIMVSPLRIAASVV